jgi:hypothetical protein
VDSEGLSFQLPFDIKMDCKAATRFSQEFAACTRYHCRAFSWTDLGDFSSKRKPTAFARWHVALRRAIDVHRHFPVDVDVFALA